MFAKIAAMSSPKKPVAPLRIFLSYGHDANEELVRRIKADLEKRGHDVWFDKNEIKFGDDWRRSITDGITEQPPRSCPSSRNIPPATPASAATKSPSPSA